MIPIMIMKKKDGYWLSICAPSGRCAAIRLEVSEEASSPIVLQVLNEVADKTPEQLAKEKP